MAIPRQATYHQVESLREEIQTLHEVSERRHRQVIALLNTLGGTMADLSNMLNELAADLDSLGTPLDNALAELEAAELALAELRGEEVRESEAAASAREAFNRIAGRFQSEPEVPDVTPLPVEEPSAPAVEPAPESGSGTDTELPSDTGNGADVPASDGDNVSADNVVAPEDAAGGDTVDETGEPRVQ